MLRRKLLFSERVSPFVFRRYLHFALQRTSRDPYFLVELCAISALSEFRDAGVTCVRAKPSSGWRRCAGRGSSSDNSLGS